MQFESRRREILRRECFELPSRFEYLQPKRNTIFPASCDSNCRQTRWLCLVGGSPFRTSCCPVPSSRFVEKRFSFRDIRTTWGERGFRTIGICSEPALGALPPLRSRKPIVSRGRTYRRFSSVHWWLFCIAYFSLCTFPCMARLNGSPDHSTARYPRNRLHVPSQNEFNKDSLTTEFPVFIESASVGILRGIE